MSVYESSDHITVNGNKVINSNIAFTTEGSDTITIFNNIFDSKLPEDSATAYVFRVNPGAYLGSNKFYNNIVLGSNKDSSVDFGREDVDWDIRNNILDGAINLQESSIEDYNIFTGLSWEQDPKYGWYPGEHSVVLDGGEDQIFVDVENRFLPIHRGASLHRLKWQVHKLVSSRYLASLICGRRRQMGGNCPTILHLGQHQEGVR